MVTRGIAWNEINTKFTYSAHTHTCTKCCEFGLSKERHQYILYSRNKETEHLQIKDEAVERSSSVSALHYKIAGLNFQLAAVMRIILFCSIINY